MCDYKTNNESLLRKNIRVEHKRLIEEYGEPGRVVEVVEARKKTESKTENAAEKIKLKAEANKTTEEQKVTRNKWKNWLKSIHRSVVLGK